MNWVVDIVTIVVSTGTLTAGFQYFNNKRRAKIEENKQELDEFKEVFHVWQEDNIRLRAREEKLLSDLDNLKSEIADLRNKIILLESAHQDLPLPAWLKDMKGVMLALNAAYEETFLIPRGFEASDYIGKTDYDIWPEEAAKAYRKHDKHVMRTGKMWHGEEKIPLKNDPNEADIWTIIKYVRYSGRTKIGIAGIAIPKSL